MAKIKIEQLIWDEWNVEHIKKHNVTQKEIEEAVVSVVTHKKGYSRRILLIGRTGTRIVSVVISKETMDRYYIVTARDADKKERKLVYEKEKKQ